MSAIHNVSFVAIYCITINMSRFLTNASQRDGSGDLNGEEYQALKSYLSVLKQQFTRWLLGPREYSMFDRILKEHGKKWAAF